MNKNEINEMSDKILNFPKNLHIDDDDDDDDNEDNDIIRDFTPRKNKLFNNKKIEKKFHYKKNFNKINLNHNAIGAIILIIGIIFFFLIYGKNIGEKLNSLSKESIEKSILNDENRVREIRTVYIPEVYTELRVLEQELEIKQKEIKIKKAKLNLE